MKTILTLCMLSVGLLSQPALASKSPSLQETILQMDKTLFDAFNQRDLDTTKAILHPDLEFYHDTGGLDDYDGTIANLTQLFANAGDLNRELLTETTEVYPIKGVGAVQTGQHRFCHTADGKPDCNVFKFVHIWKHEDERWKVLRVVSYAH